MMGQRVWQFFHRRPLVAFATDALICVETEDACAPPALEAVADWAKQHPGEPVPLIVQHTGQVDSLESFVRSSGGTVERDFRIIPALDVSLPSDRLAQLFARKDVSLIALNAPARQAAYAVAAA
jgi:hypothetical protein